jgi:hypothetical protein
VFVVGGNFLAAISRQRGVCGVGATKPSVGANSVTTCERVFLMCFENINMVAWWRGLSAVSDDRPSIDAQRLFAFLLMTLTRPHGRPFPLWRAVRPLLAAVMSHIHHMRQLIMPHCRALRHSIAKLQLSLSYQSLRRIIAVGLFSVSHFNALC